MNRVKERAAEIAKAIDSGQCKVFVDTVLPLSEAPGLKR